MRINLAKRLAAAKPSRRQWWCSKEIRNTKTQCCRDTSCSNNENTCKRNRKTVTWSLSPSTHLRNEHCKKNSALEFCYWHFAPLRDDILHAEKKVTQLGMAIRMKRIILQLHGLSRNPSASKV